MPQRQPTPPFPAQHHAKPGLESELRPAPRYTAPHYRASGKLKDKVALITGGDSGIGRAVAVLFAREGADVALNHLPDEVRDAEETQEAVERHGRAALLLPGDLGDPTVCRRIVEDTVRHFGRLDILVNNAAFQQHQASLDELSDAQISHTFDINILSMYRVTRAALHHLPRFGAIINTGSVTGFRGSEGLLDYSATKGAIHAFTKALAQNLIPRAIRVNCVAPGPVWTPLNPSDQAPEKVAVFGSDTPLGRPAQPEEIAPAYVFFASHADSSYATGEVLALLGGETTAG